MLRKDALAGICLMVCALFFLWNGRGLEIGTFDMMGPGFVPLVLATLLAGIGAVVAARAVLDDRGEALSLPRLGPIGLIFLAVGLFVFLLPPAGFVLAAAVMVALAGFAATERRTREIALMALILPAASALVFVVLLGVPLPLWPEVLR